MRIRAIVIGLAAVAILAVLAIVSIPRPLKPEQVSTRDYWPTEDWRTSAPEDQGFSSTKLMEGLQDLEEADVGIHSLLLIRNGYVVLDAYFDPYDGSFPHKLASVTKSVTTTLIGIAIDQGKLQLDQPVVAFFPERTIASLDERKKSLTVRHLAEMMNGMESGCLGGDESTLDAMRSHPDWVQAALDRKMVQDPGTRFCYDSPGMHLLSAILQKATGMTELDFARQNLFEPLGIKDVFWESDPQGYSHGWGDLYLKPRDAARIGYLWLNHGRWEDRQIVSASWIEDMVSVHSQAGSDGYGYGIWIAGDNAPDDNYFALGRGGQYIRVYPSYNAIIVVTAQALGDFEQLMPLLNSAFVSPDNPLPANPAALPQLNALLMELAQTQLPYPVGSLPDIARSISGKTMSFASNPVDVESLRLEFNDAPEATLHIMRPMVNEEIWTIGLDGNYRLSSSGEAIRGYWADPQTFIVTVFEDGLVTYEFHFDGDRVEVESPELGLRLEGQIEMP